MKRTTRTRMRTSRVQERRMSCRISSFHDVTCQHEIVSERKIQLVQGQAKATSVVRGAGGSRLSA